MDKKPHRNSEFFCLTLHRREHIQNRAAFYCSIRSKHLFRDFILNFVILKKKKRGGEGEGSEENHHSGYRTQLPLQHNAVISIKC